MLFGENLAFERKKNKFTAEELAIKTGISRSYITLLENNKRLPSKRLIPQIAEALKINPNIIIEWYLEDIKSKLEMTLQQGVKVLRYKE